MLALTCLCLLVCYGAASPTPRATDEELRVISEQIWAADVNRITGPDVVYDVNAADLYTYVNEARFTGTYELYLAMRDNYTPETGIAEACGQPCTNEVDAFLDAILLTESIRTLHAWLVNQGQASYEVAAFKEELRQYWFMPYTRSSGPMDSSGFEHVFIGEIKNGAVSGMHNWVNFYLEQKDGDWNYGTIQNTCNPEVLKFSSTWMGYNKAVTSTFVRASPEAEIAIYTLCLLNRIGGNCPVRLAGTDLTLTVWDMTGIPKTIGSAYPNC
jgi:poly(U)-specific endoribonuclease